MCARFTLAAEEKELIKQGNYTIDGPYVADPNIAVTDIGYLVTSEEPPVVQRMFWGLINLLLLLISEARMLWKRQTLRSYWMLGTSVSFLRMGSMNPKDVKRHY
ncbi:MAG: hypothetical protein WKF66_16200 [Pedobacter sp.]